MEIRQMARIRSYGPSLILLATVVMALLSGPYVVQQLAFAERDAQVQFAAEQLESQANHLAQLSEAFRLVAQRVEPSVVHISIKKHVEAMGRGRAMPMPRTPEDLFKWFEEQRRQQGRPGPQEDGEEGLEQYDVPQMLGSGSGWVYDEDGHIVTNYHVVSEAEVIEVRFNDGSTRTAELIGKDERTDIAVLKVEGGSLHPATLADTPVEQGDIVFAFGSPFRKFDFSMTQGIVSGKGRFLGILGQGGYENFIQTDAAINPGNSGGPLTNIYGKLVGMNTAIATRTGAYNGLGFAIPAGMIRHFVPQLIAEGKVKRGFLGVLIHPDNDPQLPQLLRSFGVEDGVLIDDVLADTPAAEAGLRQGDVIVAVNGEEYETGAELRRRIAQFAPNTTITLKVIRDGEPMSMDVTLAELPQDDAVLGRVERGESGDDAADATEAQLDLLRKLGFMKLETMTPSLAEEGNVDFTPGVMVTEVRPRSVAAAAMIDEGAVISSVQGKKVINVSQLAQELGSHDLSEGVRVSIRELRGGRWLQRFVLLTLDGE
jgi:serine protease Do